MRHCIESFGTTRTMLATDWPVARLKRSYDDIDADPRRVTADLTAAEQRALFHGNAQRFHRL